MKTLRDLYEWTDEEKTMALRLMQTYFSVGQGVRNFEWDWRDDRYDTWLHMTRECLKPSDAVSHLIERILHILPAVEDDGHQTLGRLVRRLINSVGGDA